MTDTLSFQIPFRLVFLPTFIPCPYVFSPFNLVHSSPTPLRPSPCAQDSHVLLPAAAGESVRPPQDAASPHLVVLVPAARRGTLVREYTNWPSSCSQRVTRSAAGNSYTLKSFYVFLSPAGQLHT